MKYLAVALSILILICGFAIWHQQKFIKTANLAVEHLYLAEDEVFDNPVKAEEEFKKSHEVWEKNEKVIALLINHDELDSINELYAELKGIYKSEKYDNYHSTSAKLVNYLKTLSENSKLNFDTVI